MKNVLVIFFALFLLQSCHNKKEAFQTEQH